MTRTLIDRPRRGSGWLALGVLLSALHAPRNALAVDDAARAVAREHFTRGVALAKSRAFAEALGEFQQAYQAAPHFAVLYNIGQAQLALGESANGVATLQRYLAGGGASIEAQRRAEVEAIIARQGEASASTAVGPTSGGSLPNAAPEPNAPAELTQSIIGICLNAAGCGVVIVITGINASFAR